MQSLSSPDLTEPNATYNAYTLLIMLGGGVKYAYLLVSVDAMAWKCYSAENNGRDYLYMTKLISVGLS